MKHSIILIYYVEKHTISFRGGYDKRQFIGKDCMLHLTKLTLNDRGIYGTRKRRVEVTETGEKLLEISRAKPTELSTILLYRFLIWWYIWFNGY